MTLAISSGCTGFHKIGRSIRCQAFKVLFVAHLASVISLGVPYVGTPVKTEQKSIFWILLLSSLSARAAYRPRTSTEPLKQTHENRLF